MMKQSIAVIVTVAILGAIGYGAVKTKPQASTQTVGQSAAYHPAKQTPNSTTTSPSSTYKDGAYDGSSIDSPYGTVQIEAVISGGKITDIKFLQMPNDRGHSQEVTRVAEPLLKQVTLQAQTANIDFVSGATSTSEAYQQSLQSALDQAVQQT